MGRFFEDRVGVIGNYDEIIRLICDSLKPNMGLEQYFEFYKKCSEEQRTRQNYNKFAEIMGEEKDNSYQKAIDLLNEYIKYAELKYGGYNVSSYLERYASGNHKAITKDNDYRRKFVIYLSSDMLKFITNNNIKEYVNAHLSKKTNQEISINGYQLLHRNLQKIW